MKIEILGRKIVGKETVDGNKFLLIKETVRCIIGKKSYVENLYKYEYQR